MKFSQQGALQWQRRFTTIGTAEEGFSVENAIGGGYILTMGFDSLGLRPLKIAKVNDLGIPEWIKRYDDINTNAYGCIRKTNDNNYIVTGENYADYFLMKITPEGDRLWLKNYGVFETQQEPYWVDQTSDGGYVITGRNNPVGTTIDDIWIVKTDDAGNEIWDKEINLYNYNDRAYKISQTLDGGYILFGQSRTTPDVLDELLMIKLGQAGSIEELGDQSGNLILYQNKPILFLP